MRILAVDTSSERGSVCIAEDAEVLGEVRLRSSVQHSDRLFRSIDFLFGFTSFALKDIDLFAAARGPGSFTGLRVGLAAMEAFSAAHAKPAAGVSTLEALAWRCGGAALIAPVIDARRGEVYAGLYRCTGAELTEVEKPVVMTPGEWFRHLPDSEIVFCGDGALLYRSYINHEGWSVREMDLYLASAIAKLALSPDRSPLSPLYVRRTEAEIARERHHESFAGSNSQD
jgi:tRNA threonylcarbamoyladenosine biosynthesis protein TsaB